VFGLEQLSGNDSSRSIEQIEILDALLGKANVALGNVGARPAKSIEYRQGKAAAMY
jgi:hypothetical protein